MMGITYGDHLIDSGYYDITPEQELDMSDHEEIEDCDDCEACKGTGTISWFDHAEGAWRDAHCTDCDGKGVKFTVRTVETRVGGGQAMSETLSACPFTPRCLEIERLVERLRADAKDTAIALARQAGEIERLREALIKARQFIENGIELGFISLPENKGDPAHDTLPAIRAALEAKP